MKRAMSDQMFHWVFVAIAGGVILLFFIMIMGSLKKTADSKSSVSMIESFDTIFTGSRASDNTLTILDAPPNTQLGFTCDSTGYSEFTIGETKAAKQNAKRIIFSHEEVIGRQFIVFTKTIELPFKVDNAIYVTEPSTQYIVIDSPTDNRGETLMDALPANMTKRNVTLTQFRALNFKGASAVVIITLDDTSQAEVTRWIGQQQTLPMKSLYRVFVQPSSQALFTSGIVQLSKTEGGRSTPFTAAHYAGEAMLVGAIFSEDTDYYACGVRKTLTRLEILAKLQHERAALLATSGSAICRQYYTESTGAFDTLASRSRILNQGGDLVLYGPGTVLEASADVAEINDQLEIQSCPLLY